MRQSLYGQVLKMGDRFCLMSLVEYNLYGPLLRARFWHVTTVLQIFEKVVKGRTIAGNSLGLAVNSRE